MKDYIPDDEEFEMILSALSYYKPRALALVSDEEVLKAAHRLTEKQKAKSDDVLAFEQAFGDKRGPLDAVDTFMADLTKEVDQVELKQRLTEAEDNLIVLCSKMIRFRDKCRTAATDEAIADLLK